MTDLNVKVLGTITHHSVIHPNAQAVLGGAYVIQPVSHTLRAAGADASEDGTGRGTPLIVATVKGGGIAPTLRVGGRDQGAGALHKSGGAAIVDISNLGVRMLTPVECERIMGWPEGQTQFGIDEKGRQYELKDSPRYQLCGNGEAKDWGEWIARRLVALENGIIP